MSGRIRTIKPEILTDAKAARLSHAAWRLWVSTWVLADDEGRLPADPDQLHGQVFWGCSADITSCLAEIQEKGLAIPYVAGGDIYLAITNFRRHQKINRPSGAKYPEPQGPHSFTGNHQGALNEGSVSEQKSSLRDLDLYRDPDRDHIDAHSVSEVSIPGGPRLDLEAAYQAYPRKQGKQRGLKLAKSKIRTDADYQTFLAAARRMGESWRGHDLTYCPHFATFVSQERWRDDQLPLPGKPGASCGPQSARPARTPRLLGDGYTPPPNPDSRRET